MSEHSVYRMLPYARQLVKLAVCDVLEQEGCLDFVRDGPSGAILADVTVYGNPGRFSIAVRDSSAGTELSVSITEPRPGLSPVSFFRCFCASAIKVGKMMAGVAAAELKYRSLMVVLIPGLAASWMVSRREKIRPSR